MTYPTPIEVDELKARLRSWANSNGRIIDSADYCTCANDNLFRGLSVGARKDFDSGNGDELGKPGGRGKLQALHSSSALACNWFDYWRGRDLVPLSRAFGVRSAFSEIVGLEQKFSTHLGGMGPNLDVVLRCLDGTLFAIECSSQSRMCLRRQRPSSSLNTFRMAEPYGAKRDYLGANRLPRRCRSTPLNSKCWMWRNSLSTCSHWHSRKSPGPFAVCGLRFLGQLRTVTEANSTISRRRSAATPLNSRRLPTKSSSLGWRSSPGKSTRNT